MIPKEIEFISALAKMKPKAAWRRLRPPPAGGPAATLVSSLMSYPLGAS